MLAGREGVCTFRGYEDSFCLFVSAAQVFIFVLFCFFIPVFQSILGLYRKAADNCSFTSTRSSVPAEIQTYRRLTNHHESVGFVAGARGGQFPASILLLPSLCGSIAVSLKDTLYNEKLFLRGFSLTLIKPFAVLSSRSQPSTLR